MISFEPWFQMIEIGAFTARNSSVFFIGFIVDVRR